MASRRRGARSTRFAERPTLYIDTARKAPTTLTIDGQKVRVRAVGQAGGAPELTEGLLSEISARIDGMKMIRAAPYDGFCGQLPEWMPGPLVEEFRALQSDLVDWYEQWRTSASRRIELYIEAARELRAFMLARAAEQRWPPVGRIFYPPQIGERLDSLNYIRNLVRIGDEKGPEACIEAYLGRAGLKVYRAIVMRERTKAMAHSSAEARRRAAESLDERILRAVANAQARGVGPRAINKTVHLELGVTPQHVGKVRRKARKLNRS